VALQDDETRRLRFSDQCLLGGSSTDDCVNSLSQVDMHRELLGSDVDLGHGSPSTLVGGSTDIAEGIDGVEPHDELHVEVPPRCPLGRGKQRSIVFADPIADSDDHRSGSQITLIRSEADATRGAGHGCLLGRQARRRRTRWSAPCSP
jgi:hypothetical protein